MGCSTSCCVLGLSVMILLVYGLALLCFAGEVAAVSCQTSQGRGVDWWSAIKAAGRGSVGASDYAYIDSTSGPEYTWIEHHGLDRPQGSSLAATLSPLYVNHSLGYVLYNDEPPTSFCIACTSFRLAHAKGVLGFDATGGFWLVHSVPKFPDSPANSTYGGIYAGQTIHAQAALCISLTPSALESVAQLLLKADLYIYSPHTLPHGLADDFPHTNRLVTEAKHPGATIPPAAVHGSLHFHSAGGEQLLAITHSSTGPGGERLRLFEDMLEPALQAGMDVQSWSEGAHDDLPSCCGLPDCTFSSHNIKHVSVPNTNLSWPCRHALDRDHSKWAVTTGPACVQHKPPGGNRSRIAGLAGDGVFCIADQNRARTQEVRGGSGVCFMQNSGVWRAFSGLIDSVEPCQQTFL